MKPISSTGFLSGCQVDLIDFMEMSEEHNRSESAVPFKWLLVYQDHFTEYVMLRLLKHNSADEVAQVLDIIFCELGPPPMKNSLQPKLFMVRYVRNAREATYQSNEPIEK